MRLSCAASILCALPIACGGASGGAASDPDAADVASETSATIDARAETKSDATTDTTTADVDAKTDAAPTGGKLGTWHLDGPTTTLRTNPTANFRGVDAAYDPTNHVFLVVYGNAPIGGAFLDDDGHQLGDGFRMTDAPYDGSNWSQLPRVAWADGGFVVTWHSSRGSSVVVQARRVHFDGAGPAFDGAAVDVATGSNQESPPSLAFSPATHELLVTWAQSDGIKAHRIGADASSKGDVIAVSPAGNWAEQPSVVFHPTAACFFVAYAQADTGARVGLARVADGTGTLVAPPRDLTGDVTFSKVTDVAFDDGVGEIVASWYAATSAGTGFFAVRVRADGEPLGAVTSVFAPYGSYDGYDLAYSPVSGTSLAAFHGTSAEDMGGEIDRTLTTGPIAAVTATGAKSGSFLPRVVAHPTRPFWLVVTSPDYAGVAVQRVGWAAP